MREAKTVFGGFLHWVGLLIYVVFFAAAQFRCVVMFYGQRIGIHIAAAQGVVDGLPHWRIYQSRVLGPYFVQLIRQLTGLSFWNSYLIATFILICLFYLILILAANDLWRSTVAMLAAAAAAFAFNIILIQGSGWLYLWDFIDLIVFTALTWAILTERPLWQIALLMIFEIFNREVVVVMGGWLLIDAIWRFAPKANKLPKMRLAIRWAQFSLALGVIGLGSLVIELLRRLLLVREIGPEIFAQKNSGTFLTILANNAHDLSLSFTRPLDNLWLVFNVLIFGIPLLALRCFLSQKINVIRSSVLYLMLWAATAALGLIYETRVWLLFVPFFVLVVPFALSNSQSKKEVPIHA